MTSRTDIIDAVQHYRTLFPAEQQTTQPLHDFLARTAADRLFTRKNFDGHITTSAFIVDADSREILLLKHKTLERWLQPGGHAEEADTSLLLSALREATEETGIAAGMLAVSHVCDNSEVPFDIDSHYIPANPKKAEDAHYHHDMRYLFIYKGTRHISYNEDESTGFKWVKFTDLHDDATFGHVVRKIEEWV